MKRLDTVYLTPHEKFAILSQYNFSDSEKDAENVEALVANEGNQAAELVNVLKEEALTDPKAVREISEATDIAPEIIEGLAETKGESLDVAKEEGLSKDEAEEYYFSMAVERLPELLNSAISKYSYQALFSDDLAKDGSSNPQEDTIEAVKIVKYVDPDAIEEQGADEVASIIAEATDGDKDVIESVLEAVEESADIQEAKDEFYFSELLATVAEQAEVNKTDAVEGTVNDLLSAFKRADEELKARIANGENIDKRALATLDGAEVMPTETDKLAVQDIPANLPETITASIKSSYTNGQVTAPAMAPAENPMLAFSNNILGRMENGMRINMPGNAFSIKNMPTNFSNREELGSKILSNVLNSAVANCRRNF